MFKFYVGGVKLSTIHAHGNISAWNFCLLTLICFFFPSFQFLPLSRNKLPGMICDVNRGKNLPMDMAILYLLKVLNSRKLLQMIFCSSTDGEFMFF